MPPKVPYKQVKVNLSPEDHARMKELAEKYDTTIATLFRELAQLNQIENAKGRRGGVKHSKTSPELLYHIAKIGSNLNQIAKHCNTHKAVDRMTLGELTKIRDELSSLLPTAQEDEDS